MIAKFSRENSGKGGEVSLSNSLSNSPLCGDGSHTLEGSCVRSGSISWSTSRSTTSVVRASSRTRSFISTRTCDAARSRHERTNERTNELNEADITYCAIGTFLDG